MGGVMSVGVTSVSEAGWGAKPPKVLAEGPALTAEVIDGLVEGGVLGMVTGAVLAAGRREGQPGSGAQQPGMASASPRRALSMLWSTAFFSASRSWAVTL